jgi:regulator of nucleoside diphosphate kinase
MTQHNDLLVCAADAEALAALVGAHGLDPREAEAAAALADALMDARMVSDDGLPGDRVAMNCLVSYREEPGGKQRTVAVVHPGLADPSRGRISVLSPVGRALLGRKRGTTTSIDVPGGRALTVRVLQIERRLREAA